MIKVNIAEAYVWRIYNCIASALLFIGALLTVTLPYWWWYPDNPQDSADIWFGDEAVQQVVKGARGMQMLAVLAYFFAFLITFLNKSFAAFLIFFGGVCAFIGPTIFLAITKQPFGPNHGISYVVSFFSVIYSIVYALKYFQRKAEER